MQPSNILAAAVNRIRLQWSGTAKFGVILGTGAGQVADQIETDLIVPYADLPGFPRSTAVGHKGQFVLGRFCGQPIIAMQGRFHLYEGYTNSQILLPLRLMRELGVELLFITNAAGGLNPQYRSGQIMVLRSHIDLMFRNWHLFEDHPKRLTQFRGSKADIYDRQLIQAAIAYARQIDVVLQQGTYAGLTGPTYETRAEYRFLRRIGADVVGMSTVPEVVYAARLGMRVLAFSTIANVANPDALLPTSGQEVVEAAADAAPGLCALIGNAVSRFSAP